MTIASLAATTRSSSSSSTRLAAVTKKYARPRPFTYRPASATTSRMVSTTAARRSTAYAPQRAREDDFKETPKSKTYCHQHEIPSLPIPTLEATGKKFLNSARPFVSDVQPNAPVASDQNPTKEYERLKAAVKDFTDSPFVKELQERLVQHAKGKDNWIIDWFNTANYFGMQRPI